MPKGAENLVPKKKVGGARPGAGRPSHQPTPETRAIVRAFSGYVGMTQEHIAAYLKISIETLVKHYREELTNAAPEANATIAECLFNKAKKGDTAAMIFWLKARAKWSEKVVETPADDDVPMPTKITIEVVDASVPRD